MNIKITIFAFLLAFLFSSTSAKPNNIELQQFETFVMTYYLDPQPQKAPAMLGIFLKSELFTDEKTCDEHCQKLIAYTFARIAQSEPNLISKYQVMFDKGTDKQRIFLLYVLQSCGNENVKSFLIEKLNDRNYAGIESQIKLALDQGIPLKLNVLTRSIQEAGDLDLLWSEFFVSGNSDAIRQIIVTLGWIDTGQVMQKIIGHSARWSLTSNCKQHKKVLKICQEEYTKSKWPQRRYLAQIIRESGGSIVPKELAGKKMIKIITRNTTEGIDVNSFAALPITAYIFGKKCGRVEEQPDKSMNLHELIIVNEPDCWMINLLDKTGQHAIDTDPNSLLHSPIITVNDKQDSVFNDFEYGYEFDFLRAKNATKSQIKLNSVEYDLYSMTIKATKVELIAKKDKNIPRMVRIFNDGKLIQSITYDEYTTGIEPNMALFEPADDIRISEAKADSNH
jgi:hypothetical protein